MGSVDYEVFQKITDRQIVIPNELEPEIVDLIDREADMLNRGRSETSLEGLRLRLSNLFLQFIETPEFNPEAARFQKLPRELLQQT